MKLLTIATIIIKNLQQAQNFIAKNLQNKCNSRKLSCSNSKFNNYRISQNKPENKNEEIPNPL